jgi:hypothetical protein
MRETQHQGRTNKTDTRPHDTMSHIRAISWRSDGCRQAPGAQSRLQAASMTRRSGCGGADPAHQLTGSVST